MLASAQCRRNIDAIKANQLQLLTNAAANADRQKPAAANTLGADGPPYATRYGISDVKADMDPAHNNTIPIAGTIQCTPTKQMKKQD